MPELNSSGKHWQDLYHTCIKEHNLLAICSRCPSCEAPTRKVESQLEIAISRKIMALVLKSFSKKSSFHRSLTISNLQITVSSAISKITKQHYSIAICNSNFLNINTNKTLKIVSAYNTPLLPPSGHIYKLERFIFLDSILGKLEYPVA